MVAFRSAVFLVVAASLAASPACMCAAEVDQDVRSLMESVNLNMLSMTPEDSGRGLQETTPTVTPSAAPTATSGSSKALPASAAFATIAAVAAVLAGSASMA